MSNGHCPCVNRLRRDLFRKFIARHFSTIFLVNLFYCNFISQNSAKEETIAEGVEAGETLNHQALHDEMPNGITNGEREKNTISDSNNRFSAMRMLLIHQLIAL